MSYELYRRERSPYWHYDLTVSGKRERKSTRTTDRQLAEDIASKRDWELRRAAVHGPESVLTFGTACGLYLDARKSERFLAPLFERWETTLVKDVTPGAIKAAARELYPGAGPATWNRQVITPAQAVINFAAESELCPHIRVKRFAAPRAIRRAVDRSYIDRFCANASADLGALQLFMFQSGCRISAATALTWDAVSLHDRTVILGRDKNGDPHRIHLTTEMLALLANLPKDRRKVFGYASRHAVYGSIKRACGRAGLPYLGTHQPGRHSFATEMMVRKGVDPVTTAKLGNWRSPRVLMENYGHAENEAEIIQRVFGTLPAHRKRSALK